MRSTTSSKSTTPAPTPATGRSKSKAKSKPNAPNSSKNNSKQNRSKQPAANTKSLIPRPYHERARQKHMETIASSLLAVHTKYFRHNLSPVQSMTSFLRSAGGESVSRSLSLLSENARVLDITTYKSASFASLNSLRSFFYIFFAVSNVTNTFLCSFTFGHFGTDPERYMRDVLCFRRGNHLAAAHSVDVR